TDLISAAAGTSVAGLISAMAPAFTTSGAAVSGIAPTSAASGTAAIPVTVTATGPAGSSAIRAGLKPLPRSAERRTASDQQYAAQAAGAKLRQLKEPEHQVSASAAVVLPAPRHDRRRMGAAGLIPGGFPSLADAARELRSGQEATEF